MKKTFPIIFFFFLFSFLLPSLIKADGLVPCDISGPNACTFCDFFVMIDRIIDFLLIKIVPALAALMIAIGGLIYIFSRSDPKMLSWAKDLFTSVVYGLLIIYGAFVIIGLFFWFIGLNTWTNDIYHNWWENGIFEINCH